MTLGIREEVDWFPHGKRSKRIDSVNVYMTRAMSRH